MGVSASSGKVTASIILTGIGLRTLVSMAREASATAAETTIATVPANRQWKVLGIELFRGGNVDVTYKLAGAEVAKIYGTGTLDGPAKFGFIESSFIKTLAAGETIQRTLSAAVTCTHIVYYYEEVV